MPPRVTVAPEPAPVQAVERPILCSPYEEPREHWVYQGPGEAPTRVSGRRPASYYYTTRRVGAAQLDLYAEQQRDELELVNLLRADVKRWRDAGYPGAEQVTRQLLRHWARDDLPRRLFFCQREAAETVIYITEILASGRKLQWKQALLPEDFARLIRGERPSFVEAGADWFPRLIDPPVGGGAALVRYGCKMATGSGKTVVMAMLIAWTLCNRGRRPADTRFPSAVLVVCPNLTVKERLQVLRPEHPENYYEAFDLVPSPLRTELGKGRVLVENWHRFLPEGPNVDGGKSYAVVNKGPEGPEAFARRVLGDLYDRGPILVLNDEAHHAYRPAPVADEREAREHEAERQEATVWAEGLDRINEAVGIAFCVDLSATPFYIAGSGYPEGTPFPWLVSDFGLVDAIEAGIVKIPRLPVAESSGRPVPRYYALWRHIVDGLQAGERLPGGKPKPEAVWREAQDALVTLAGQWVERFEQLQSSSVPGIDRTPPVLIIVCDNTDIAEYFFRKISGQQEVEVEADEAEDGDDDTDQEQPEPAPRRRRRKKTRIIYGTGEVFPEYFSNTAEHPLRTIRIDSKLLAEAESRIEAGSRTDAAERLREIVATVGQPGKPGEQVRCVISVQMLSEGWDANNVTHILGLRAFGSQLLCEQVVGRGLRRMDYVPDPETGLLTEEYVDVYGVPFSLIPFRGRDIKGPPPDDRPRFHVYALPERSHLQIRFPIVEGYAFALRSGVVKADIASLEPLVLDPVETPQAVFVKPQVGVEIGPPSLAGGFETELQDRTAYYASTHLQTIEFEIARQIVGRLLATAKDGHRGRVSRHLLFPRILRFVDEYVRTRVDFRGCDPREIGLERYAGAIVERIFAAIRPDEDAGEPPLLPLLNRHRPIGDTSVVNFKTVKPCFPTRKSHINLVAADTGTWEQAAAFALEASDVVEAYARNERLEFSIPYEYHGVPHAYYPDFLVRLVDKSTLVLEIKGQEADQDRAKYVATDRWIAAVNNWGRLGRWRWHVCRDPQRLRQELEQIVAAVATA